LLRFRVDSLGTIAYLGSHCVASMRISILTLTILLVLPAGLVSGESPPKIIRATRTTIAPVLDGAVNEPAWQSASPVLDFTQAEPVEAGQATELTSVRMLYDDNALYVGVICYDADPSGIVGKLSRRDRTTEADRFSVLIDSYFDRKSAFVFSTNVSGVQSDGILSQGGSVYDLTWDAVWDVRTQVYLDGWSAEFKIPFTALRFAEDRGRELVWGVNFRRYISRKKEVDDWVMVPRTEAYEIPKWGTLQGIRDIPSPIHLEFAPYVAGSTTIQSAAEATPRSTSNIGRAGLDIKYGLARNFTLDATFNPDFGQVEVDQAVLNLTVFETRYPEKRPFFVEGAQFFTFGSSYDDTPLPLFFSRRIGKRPTLGPSISPPTGGSIVENPAQTTILGAAKFSGRSSSGLSVGVLSAVTDEEEATLRDGGGMEWKEQIEPRASYTAVRMRQEFSQGSWLGGIATAAARTSARAALSGGVDWNLHLGGETHSLDGYLAGARSWSGDQELTGGAGRLLFSRIAGSRWSYLASYNFATRNFNVNDLGFYAQPHDHGGYTQLLYRVLTPEGGFLRYGGSIVPEARWNWDGVLTMAQAEATVFGTFMNFWTAVLKATYRLAAYDDAEQGILGTYRRPSALAVTGQVTTDERQDIVLTLAMQGGGDRNGKSQFLVSGDLKFRPTSFIEVNPSVLYLRVRNEVAAAISNGRVDTVSVGGTLSSIYGDRDLDELDLGVRGIVTFTRTLSLQFYTQLLMARGKYEHYRRLVTSTTFAEDFVPRTDHDFHQATFNANVLLRWEFIPGSTFYLVWTQSRYGDSGLYSTGFGERFTQAFALPHEDVLFAKVTYWLPL
jgi:hypothetical protein